MYTVVTPRRVQRVIENLSTSDARRIVAALKDLQHTPRPRGCVKLQGENRWRIRVGDYRIVYEIEDDRLLVTVVRVAHRRDVYR